MILYLDTSSLVKLYLDEIGSADVRRQVAEANVVATSVVAYPEARSAFARLAREGLLTPEELSEVHSAFHRDWSSFLRVGVLVRVYQHAGDLAEGHGLRGFDAIHLASFLEVAAQAGDEPVAFSAFDARLNAAAEAVRSPPPSTGGPLP